ncbi:MAG: hypothetical protein QF797_01200 [Alphaproteobacteria bacterium]|nr:hypothetical protein [Alphaproteobacteria bacterium]
MAYFDRVDVNRIAAELRVADRAAEEGRRQQKLAGTDGSVDDTQRIIMGAMTERWNLARTRAEEALKDIEVKLSGIDLGATLNVLNTLKADTEMEVERTKGRFRDRLFGLRRHEGEMRSDLDFFQLKNDLHREAEYPESEILHWAIVVALVVTESLANSYFFAKGSDLGLLGGALQALLISCVNIGAALMAGVYLLRNLHHVETWRLGLSAMATCAYLVFMVFLNLATAHYRALLGSDPLTAIVTVFKSLVENPFAINDFDASILLFIGIILAIAALVKAYMADDRYPGYGKFDRRYREADEAYNRLPGGSRTSSGEKEIWRTTQTAGSFRA